MIANWIAEQLLKLSFYIADVNSVRGANIKQSVIDYFERFRYAPPPRWFKTPTAQSRTR